MKTFLLVTVAAALSLIPATARSADAERIRSLHANIAILKAQITRLRREIATLKWTVKNRTTANAALKANVSELLEWKIKKQEEAAAAKRKADNKVPHEFTIDEYSFEWTVAQSGKAHMSICKTQDRMYVELQADDDSIWISPAQTVKIGKALAQVDRYYRKSKDAKGEVTDSVSAGKYNVRFWKSPKWGFTVLVKSTAAFSMTTVSLSRKQAKQLAPYLLKAARLAAFVKDKIKP